MSQAFHRQRNRLKLYGLLTLLLSLLVWLIGPQQLQAQQPPDLVYGYRPYAPEELQGLVAPIALYPDPLLAQILPAATFVDQIDEAARYVRRHGRSGIDLQPWDVSVRAVAHYPDLLYMLDQHDDWTSALGQAFAYQPEETMDAIQALRTAARDAGSLISTPQQQVVVEGGEIRILPAQPQVIYLPTYDPQVVYYQPYSYGLISFGVGFSIGAWLNRDCDWRGRRIYYHGWRGNGWIRRSRPHVRVRNSPYIANRYRDLHINRGIIARDTSSYRQRIEREPLRPRPGGATHRGETGSAARPRGTQATPPTATPPRVTTSPPAASPGTAQPSAAPSSRRDLYRGRDTGRNEPASRSGYGGYGSSRDASLYRERGRASQQQMHQRESRPPSAARPERPAATRRQAPLSRPAPTPRAAPAPSPAPVPHAGGEGGRRGGGASVAPSRPSASPSPGGGGGEPRRR